MFLAEDHFLVVQEAEKIILDSFYRDEKENIFFDLIADDLRRGKIYGNSFHGKKIVPLSN